MIVRRVVSGQILRRVIVYDTEPAAKEATDLIMSAYAFEEEFKMNMNRAVQFTYCLLRVVTGFLFCQAGCLILFGWFGGMPGQPSPPPLLSQTGIGGVLEFFGGILVMLGLFTRPVAFVLSGMMAVAYWQFHAPQGGWPVQNQGMPAVLFCFIFLYMATQGAGDWGLDALLRRRRAAATGAQ